MYRGIVIEESLTDWAWINQVRILDAEIETSPNDPQGLWHLYTVEASEEQVRALEKLLKPDRYYAHFSNESEGMVVFPNQTFRVNPDDASTWQEAIHFGIQIKKKKKQMNFAFDGLVEK